MINPGVRSLQVSESMKDEAIPYIKGWMPTVLSLLTKEDLKPAAIYALGAFTLASKCR